MGRKVRRTVWYIFRMAVKASRQAKKVVEYMRTRCCFQLRCTNFNLVQREVNWSENKSAISRAEYLPISPVFVGWINDLY